MLKISALLFSLIAATAQASPDRISLVVGARHIGATGFHDINPGRFLTWERAPVDISVGVFRNSYKRTSIAASAYVPMIAWAAGNAGLFAGVAHYPGDGRKPRPHVGDVVPIGGFQIRHKGFFAQFTPMDGKPVDALLVFGLTWPLNSKFRKARP